MPVAGGDDGASGDGECQVWMPERTKAEQLLLVVHRSTHELLSLRVDSTHCDRAALALGRHFNATTSNALTASLEVEPQCAVIDLRIRARVGIRVAGDRIVFSVELARPLIMNRLTIDY